MSRIVLASGSPRRQELLNRIGITDFDIRVPQTDEHYPAGLTPAQIVEYIPGGDRHHRRHHGVSG